MKTQPVFQVVVDLTQPVLIQILLQIDTQKEASLDTRTQKILDQAQGISIFDGGVYFVDHQGTVVKTWPEQPDVLGHDWSETPHFSFMIDHPGKAAYSDLRTIESSGIRIICVSVPMNGLDGEFVGAGYYCFAIDPPSVYYEAYSKTYRDLGLAQNMYIVDGNQRIIFSLDSSQLGRDLSEADYLQQLLQGQSQSSRFRVGKEDVLVSYAPLYTFTVNLVRWNLIKEENWADIMQPLKPYQQLLIALLTLGVIVPVLVTAYGVRYITTPIQELMRASVQVTTGQFNHRIEVSTGDEIEALANQFNLMSAELADSYSSLETKVADRTRELAVINSIISVASRSLNIQEILRDALTKTVEHMRFDAGAAYKLDANPDMLRLVTQLGFDSTNALALVRKDIITSDIDTTDDGQKVTTFEPEDYQNESVLLQLSQSGFRLFVTVPLSMKGNILGLFILGKLHHERLSPEQLSLLNSIGKQVGVAMENARLYEQAEQSAITSERHRLARELHDAVTQTLFSANLIADVIPKIWRRNPEEGMQNLEELHQLTRGALAEMRALLLEMRPESLERADIKTLITQLADAFIGRVRVPLDLTINGECQLTPEVKLVFYRITQEALNNIAKHSGARHVKVHLECQLGGMNLVIKDDGLGFDLSTIAPGHLGIAIMHERANSIGASLKIDSQFNRGTTVELEWRLAQEERTDE